jgi:hypothetical protein
MKKILIAVSVAVFTLGMISCHKKGEVPPEMKLDADLLKDTTTITFLDTTTFHFDTINQGDKVEHTFKIKNTGQNNLVIARAFGSCGCTVPDYPKDPVKPGETFDIHVTFNSAGKSHEQMKSVTVVCNTVKRNEMLFLNGFVRVKEDAEKSEPKKP